MSSDKRRRARVQGGWAGPSKTQRSDRNKTPMATPPSWLGTDPADPVKQQRFVYKDAGEEVRVKPKERLIDETGVYDISEGEKGVARLRLFKDFIEPNESKHYFDRFIQEIPWKQQTDKDKRSGVEFLQPRLTAWFGEHPYSYSGLTHGANKQWPTLLEGLKDRLEANTGLQFNSVLLNLYRDNHDSVAWHTDNELSLGPQPTIASISFGDVRNFELRKLLPKGTDEAEYEYVDRVKVPLTPGSLLIMEGATQDDWQHRIPREYHDRGPRINLTFRVIYPQQ